jgi:hypothetical protein
MLTGFPVDLLTECLAVCQSPDIGWIISNKEGQNQVPDTKMTRSRQVPDTEVTPSRQVADTEVTPSRQVPDTEVTPSRQVPDTEVTPSRDTDVPHTRHVRDTNVPPGRHSRAAMRARTERTERTERTNGRNGGMEGKTTAANVQGGVGGFPKTTAAVRRRFPLAGADFGAVLAQVAQGVLTAQSKLPTLTDEILLQAVEVAEAASPGQKKQGLFLRTVPAVIRSWAENGRPATPPEIPGMAHGWRPSEADNKRSLNIRKQPNRHSTEDVEWANFIHIAETAWKEAEET